MMSASEAFFSVGHRDLKGHVHTALKVKAQIELLVFALFVGVPEIDFLVVHARQILAGSGIHHGIGQMFLQHNVTVCHSLHLLEGRGVIGELRRLALHTP